MKNQSTAAAIALATPTSPTPPHSMALHSIHDNSTSSSLRASAALFLQQQQQHRESMTQTEKLDALTKLTSQQQRPARGVTTAQPPMTSNVVVGSNNSATNSTSTSTSTSNNNALASTIQQMVTTATTTAATGGNDGSSESNYNDLISLQKIQSSSFTAKSRKTAHQFLLDNDNNNSDEDDYENDTNYESYYGDEPLRHQKQRGHKLEHQAIYHNSNTSFLHGSASSSEYSQDMEGHHDSFSTHNAYNNNSNTSDLDWNPKEQKQQQEEWRNRAKHVTATHQQQQQQNKSLLGDIAGRHHSKIKNKNNAGIVDSASTNLFANRQDLRHVDQTINLMDASLGDYYADSNNSTYGQNYKSNDASSGRAPNTFLGKMQSSLVDIWLDERSHNTKSTQQQQQYRTTRSQRRRRKVNVRSGGMFSPQQRHQGRGRPYCQELCCNWLSFVLVMAGLVGAFAAWKMGAFTTKTDGNFISPANTDTPVVTIVPESSILDDFQAYLVEHNVSSSEDLQQEKSSQYLALHWISSLEDPSLLLDHPILANKQEDLLMEAKLEVYSLAVLYCE